MMPVVHVLGAGRIGVYAGAELVASLEGGQSHPGPRIHRLTMGAVVGINPASGGEVPGDPPGYGVHAVAEELKRLRASGPKPGGCLGVADVAHDLEISDQSIYTWRRQERIDRGVLAGLTSVEKAELMAAKKRITDLEAELAVSRRAVELLKEEVGPKGGSRRPR